MLFMLLCYLYCYAIYTAMLFILLCYLYCYAIYTAMLFQVPQGDDERLNKIPSLVGKEFQFTGIDKFTAAIDIQLSTLGEICCE